MPEINHPVNTIIIPGGEVSGGILGDSALKDFSDQIHEALQVEDGPIPRHKLTLLKELCFAVSDPIQLPLGVDIPGPEVSATLLDILSKSQPAIGYLATRITLSELGCWNLPLKAEYDEKNRARYPQISKSTLGAKNELAHRFVMRTCLGATLGRLDFIDHVCRSHACCNLTHLDFATPRANLMRSLIHQRSVRKQERLF